MTLSTSAPFNPKDVVSLIQRVSHPFLKTKRYQKDDALDWVSELKQMVSKALQEMGQSRYKYIVTVDLGENKGEGVRMDAKCSWDTQLDNMAQDTFINDSLYCVVTVFGVYVY